MKTCVRSVASACTILLAGFVHAADVAPAHHEPNVLNSAKAKKAHYVVMVSLDGFRWDYASKWGSASSVEDGRRGSERAGGNAAELSSDHLPLVTGLYPEHHGIVGNEFRDPKRDYAEYLFNSHAINGDGSWYGGVPLWSLAERKKMRSASMYWVGSEAEIAGKRPSYWVPFDDNFDDERRIDQVIAWLSLPETERPHLITLYYSNADHAGHDFGAEQTGEAVRHLDALIGEWRTG